MLYLKNWYVSKSNSRPVKCPTLAFTTLNFKFLIKIFSWANYYYARLTACNTLCKRQDNSTAQIGCVMLSSYSLHFSTKCDELMHYRLCKLVKKKDIVISKIIINTICFSAICLYPHHHKQAKAPLFALFERWVGPSAACPWKNMLCQIYVVFTKIR